MRSRWRGETLRCEAIRGGVRARRKRVGRICDEANPALFFLPRHTELLYARSHLPACRPRSRPQTVGRLSRAMIDTTGKMRMSEWPDESLRRTV